MAPGTMGWWSPRRSLAAGQLVAECEAFATGRLAELYQQRDGYVPVWTWTNLLAHGDVGVLRRAYAVEQDRPIFSEQRWQAARSFLAGEVLALGLSEGPLAEVQRSVLVPIELDLAKDRSADSWLPARWVSTVVAALDDRRRVRRH